MCPLYASMAVQNTSVSFVPAQSCIFKKLKNDETKIYVYDFIFASFINTYKVSQQYKKFIKSNRPKFSYTVSYRSIGRSENPGVPELSNRFQLDSLHYKDFTLRFCCKKTKNWCCSLGSFHITISSKIVAVFDNFVWMHISGSLHHA